MTTILCEGESACQNMWKTLDTDNEKQVNAL